MSSAPRARRASQWQRSFSTSCSWTDVCTDEDLEQLDSDEMQPIPVDPQHLIRLERAFHDHYNEKKTVCAVCDQFCLISSGKYYSPTEVPEHFFKKLMTPDGKEENSAKPLHPQLIAQYSACKFFPGDHRFKGLLLSTKGISKFHSCNGSEDCACPSNIFICEKY